MLLESATSGCEATLATCEQPGDYDRPVIHQPRPISEGLPPYAIALAEHGRNGRMVVYAGAGMSRAEPTALPLGEEVARSLYDRLRGPFPQIAGCDPGDLTSVADAVTAQPGGEEALRLAASRVAEFTTATPAYGHRVLAQLLLEGVVDALTTNWDDCIERSGGREWVPVVVTEGDLLDIPAHSLLKIHGCARRPASLLITTEHLDQPPAWVNDQTRARLGTSVLAFVGIGDVAGYVGRRIEEAIDSVGDADNVRIVGPDIVDNWASSAWSTLTPDLSVEHRIPATSDQFLEQVGGAYVHVNLADLIEKVRDDERLAEAATIAVSAIEQHDALQVLVWLREGAVVAPPGRSVLGSETMDAAVLALGLLLGGGFEISAERIVVSDDRRFEVLTATGTQPASRLRREARNRLEQHLGRGLSPPTFLVAGGVGWGHANSDGPSDIVGDGHPDDLINGPLSAEPAILRAEEVIG